MIVREGNWGGSWGRRGRAKCRSADAEQAYIALVNNTASLWSVPRASAMNFPSGDQPKSQTTPEVKWVNCFVEPSCHGYRALANPLHKLGVPERMSTTARERPSGVQRATCALL